MAKGVKLTIEDVNKYVNENSNCILISNEYIGCHNKLQFKCSCGNLYHTTFKRFKTDNQRQCPQCGKKRISKNSKLTIYQVKEFIEENNCTLESSIYERSMSKLNIRCKCGEIFHVSFHQFKSNNQRCCPKCSSKRSKGEIKIQKYLDNNNIINSQEFTFGDLFSDTGYKIRFDFAVFDENNVLKALIEYQGIQHYEPVDFAGNGKEWGENKLNKQQHKDKMKVNYCKDHNIPLIIIKYDRFSYIEDELSKELKSIS